MIEIIYKSLGSKWCGNINVPLDDGRKTYLNKELLATFRNDAFEVWIGTSDEWCFHLSRPELHKLIRWYLYQWIIAEWFGLRRRIWYWALKKKCKRLNDLGKQ